MQTKRYIFILPSELALHTIWVLKKERIIVMVQVSYVLLWVWDKSMFIPITPMVDALSWNSTEVQCPPQFSLRQ